MSGIAQSSLVTPDSIQSPKMISDTVVTSSLTADSILTHSVNSHIYVISELSSNFNNSPVFVGQDSSVGYFTTRADSFALQIPASAFRPMNFEAEGQTIQPDYYAASQIFQGGLTWGIDAFIPFIAPFQLSLNNTHRNIRLKEIEVCALDQNSDMNLLAILHETYFDSSFTYVDSVRMYAVSSGGGLNNRKCWQAPITVSDSDNFNLSQADKTYWIEVVPIKEVFEYTPGDSLNPEYGNWPPLNTGNPNTPNGKLRLLNVRVYYSHK
ncbi:hypothetical protein [Jiulongibacter sp. NS-SX5]|uniref:hypothetical protein n=1 Tax=Jiulongibacter sp. NS-SX5 TaxID=3463854 RepID=UPI00405A0BBB